MVVGGAPLDDKEAPAAGAVYLFDGGTGALLQVFRKSSPNPGDEFGVAVAVVAGSVLVGAPLDDTVAVDAGAAYLFDRPTGELLFTFVDPAAGGRDQVGPAVAALGSA